MPASVGAAEAATKSSMPKMQRKAAVATISAAATGTAAAATHATGRTTGKQALMSEAAGGTASTLAEAAR